MKVLVTGGAGHIGAMTIAHLLRQGFGVAAFDKCLFGAEPLLAFFGPSFQFIHGDIRDPDPLYSAMKGIDAVVHLAALVGEAACSVDTEAARSINLDGTKLVLSIAEQCNVKRFIFVSTCSNYGISSSNTLTTEESLLNPLTEYAISKVLAEEAVLKSTAPLITTVLRFGTLCGLSPRMRFDLLVNDIARAAALDQPIQVFAPDAWRPFLHIKDAARVIEHCLKASPQSLKNEVFNVVSENVQKKDLCTLVKKHFPSASIDIVSKSPDLRDYRASVEKIKQQLQFFPSFTIEDAFLEVAQAVKHKIFLDPFRRQLTGVPENIESLSQTCMKDALV